MCSTLLERPLGVKLSKPFSRTTPSLFVIQGQNSSRFFFLVFPRRLLSSRCEEVHLKVAHFEPSYYFTISPFFLTI